MSSKIDAKHFRKVICFFGQVLQRNGCRFFPAIARQLMGSRVHLFSAANMKIHLLLNSAVVCSRNAPRTLISVSVLNSADTISITFFFLSVLLSFPAAAARQGCRGGSYLLPGQSRACGDGPGPGAVQKPAGRRGNPLCGPRSPASPGKTLISQTCQFIWVSCHTCPDASS